MNRVLAVVPAVAVFFGLLAAQPRAARAGIQLSFSLGEAVYFVDGDAERSPVSLELTPSYAFEWVKLDLALFAYVEDLDIVGPTFALRPGVRVTPPVLPVYARFAIPLHLADEFDYGFLLGAGGELSLLDVIAFFLEVNTFFTDDGDWTGAVPLEFRLGARITFD